MVMVCRVWERGDESPSVLGGAHTLRVIFSSFSILTTHHPPAHHPLPSQEPTHPSLSSDFSAELAMDSLNLGPGPSYGHLTTTTQGPYPYAPPTYGVPLGSPQGLVQQGYYGLEAPPGQQAYADFSQVPMPSAHYPMGYGMMGPGSYAMPPLAYGYGVPMSGGPFYGMVRGPSKVSRVSLGPSPESESHHVQRGRVHLTPPRAVLTPP